MFRPMVGGGHRVRVRVHVRRAVRRAACVIVSRAMFWPATWSPAWARRPVARLSPQPITNGGQIVGTVVVIHDRLFGFAVGSDRGARRRGGIRLMAHCRAGAARAADTK
jgi:hypothetical protein